MVISEESPTHVKHNRVSPLIYGKTIKRIQLIISTQYIPLYPLQLVYQRIQHYRIEQGTIRYLDKDVNRNEPSI